MRVGCWLALLSGTFSRRAGEADTGGCKSRVKYRFYACCPSPGFAMMVSAAVYDDGFRRRAAIPASCSLRRQEVLEHIPNSCKVGPILEEHGNHASQPGACAA